MKTKKIMRTVQCTYINRVSSSYFFLFFEPIPIFSYFGTKTTHFSYFLDEAKKNGIIVVCVFGKDLS